MPVSTPQRSAARASARRKDWRPPHTTRMPAVTNKAPVPAITEGRSPSTLRSCSDDGQQRDGPARQRIDDGEISGAVASQQTLRVQQMKNHGGEQEKGTFPHRAGGSQDSSTTTKPRWAGVAEIRRRKRTRSNVYGARQAYLSVPGEACAKRASTMRRNA